MPEPSEAKSVVAVRKKSGHIFCVRAGSPKKLAKSVPART